MRRPRNVESRQKKRRLKTWDRKRKRNTKCRTWIGKKKFSSKIKIGAFSECMNQFLEKRRNKVVTNLYRCIHLKLNQQPSLSARSQRSQLTKKWKLPRRSNQETLDKTWLIKISTILCLRLLNSWIVSHLKSITKLKMKASHIQRHNNGRLDRKRSNSERSARVNRGARILQCQKLHPYFNISRWA